MGNQVIPFQVSKIITSSGHMLSFVLMVNILGLDLVTSYLHDLFLALHLQLAGLRKGRVPRAVFFTYLVSGLDVYTERHYGVGWSRGGKDT